MMSETTPALKVVSGVMLMITQSWAFHEREWNDNNENKNRFARWHWCPGNFDERGQTEEKKKINSQCLSCHCNQAFQDRKKKGRNQNAVCGLYTQLPLNSSANCCRVSEERNNTCSNRTAQLNSLTNSSGFMYIRKTRRKCSNRTVCMNSLANSYRYIKKDEKKLQQQNCTTEFTGKLLQVQEERWEEKAIAKMWSIVARH